MAKYHLTNEGPKICRAKTKSCPYGDVDHYPNLKIANINYLKVLEKESRIFPETRQKIVDPTKFGFHCNGDCWEGQGKIEELVRDMLNHSQELTNWFVNAEWATEENLTKIHLDKISEIHPIQNWVNLGFLKRTLNSGTDHNSSSRKEWEKYPAIFRYQGKFFIWQGTHRLALAKIQNKKMIEGWIVDLDDTMKTSSKKD